MRRVIFLWDIAALENGKRVVSIVQSPLWEHSQCLSMNCDVSKLSAALGEGWL